MKNVILSLFFIFNLILLEAQPIAKVQYFELGDVELLPSPFKHACELDKKYLLEMDVDRLLAPFLREASLPTKAESYTNWENTGLDGHIGGHYLSAISLMYAATKDEQIKRRLDYMLNELQRVQDANGDGYIGGVPGGKAIWKEISEGNIRASAFDLNGKWVPLYNIHKTYAGLRDAYLYYHSEKAKAMLIKMTDWMIAITDNLSQQQIQDMLRSEHGGLNETFADVAAITGDKKYLALAHKFSQNEILNPLLRNEDKLTGMHANTQIPKVIGFKRIADVEGNADWSEASNFFWQTVVKHRSVCIGGNSVGEHFNPIDDFSRVIKSVEGPETCNTYNMLRLSRMLYATSLDKDYIEYYEKALYNHILTTQHPEEGGFVYFTQMRPGHYRVYSQPHTSMWCCVGSGLENHAKYGEMIYAHTGNDLYVNLFIPSKLRWSEKGVEIIQENKFPDEGSTHFIVNPEKNIQFTLNLRQPSWVGTNTLVVKINGKPYKVSTFSNGYVSIDRIWKKGDRVDVELPMHVTVEQLPDKSNYYSFFYGPLVLAAKTGTEEMTGLFADDSRGGHIAHGKQIPLKDIPIVVGEANSLAALLTPVKDKSLTFSLTSLYPYDAKKSFELIPFYKVFDSRYIIYWPQATDKGVQDIRRQIELEEAERLQLDEITIDKVVCGEQQPESDHFIQSEKSEIGFTEGLHWRESEKWFSYTLKNKDKQAKTVYLQYFNSYWERKFDILINDIKVATVITKDGADEEILVSEFAIPESETDKLELKLTIKSYSNSMTSRIAEVRISQQSKYKSLQH